MTQRTTLEEPVRTGPDVGAPLASGERPLWIGEHAGDHDILVLDPAQSDSTADVLALYSLTQHRMRRFPRATVEDRIRVVTDESARSRAARDYGRRAELQADHQRAADSAQAERMDRIREGMVAAHKVFVEALTVEYRGVRKTSEEGRGGKATRCHVCALALDDFVGMTCVTCSGVLCSCGACACGKPSRGRRSAASTPTTEIEA
jgi:hypothetical protein